MKGQEYTLKVDERIYLEALQPEKGNAEELNQVQKLKDDLLLTEEEVKKYDFKEKGKGEVQWNSHKDDGKTIFIPGNLLKNIKKELKELDGKEELHINQLSLYNKIIGGDKKE